MADEREWRVEIDIKMDSSWDEAVVKEQVLMRLNGGEYVEIAEIVSMRPLWEVTKDETPADATEKSKPWMCWEDKPAWLSWCQQIVDIDEMVPHIRGCAVCSEFLAKLSQKVELKR